MGYQLLEMLRDLFSYNTIPTSATLEMSGAFASTITMTAATNVTLPTTGTLETLAGRETFTNKTLTTPMISIIQSSNRKILWNIIFTIFIV